MGTRTNTRDRMVTSAAVLLREHGVAGTSIAKVLAHAHAPRGSVGFHFPGGKTELVHDAVVWAGSQVDTLLTDAADRGIPAAEVFVALCTHYQRQLEETDYRAGCPIGAAAHDAHGDDALRPVVDDVLGRWQDALAGLLVTEGHDPDRADQLASLGIASLEGAILLARVRRTTAPIAAVIAHVAPLLDTGSV